MVILILPTKKTNTATLWPVCLPQSPTVFFKDLLFNERLTPCGQKRSLHCSILVAFFFSCVAPYSKTIDSLSVKVSRCILPSGLLSYRNAPRRYRCVFLSTFFNLPLLSLSGKSSTTSYQLVVGVSKNI